MAEDTVTVTNRTPFDESNYKVWWCDGSWTGSNGGVSITGVPFKHVYMVQIIPQTGTWATAWECTTLGKLATEGTVSFTGLPTSGATTARFVIWGY